MLTINQTLPRPTTYLQQFQRALNNDMRNLDMLMPWRKRKIPVDFKRTEYISLNGHTWECQHINTAIEYIPTCVDDSELLTVCDDCGAQYIKGEWRPEN